MRKTIQVGEKHFVPGTKLLSVNDDARTIRYVLSNSSPDRLHDTIDVSGWQLDNYKKNPVLLLGHDKRGLPIGRALEIGVVGSNLEGVYQFAPADTYPLADTVYRLAKGGFMSAGSVGFMPITYSFNDDTGGIDFKTQELLEFSAVTVPCHPEALSMDMAKGIGITSDQISELRAALSATKGAQAPQLGRFKTRAAINSNQVRLSDA